MIYLCILVHACSVWCCLVYLLFPVYPVCEYYLVMSCLDVLIKYYIWVYILVCVFLFLPRVCTVTEKAKRASKHFPFNIQFHQYSPVWSLFWRQMNRNHFSALWYRCALIISVHNWICQDAIYSVKLRVERCRNGYWGYFRVVHPICRDQLKLSLFYRV